MPATVSVLVMRKAVLAVVALLALSACGSTHSIVERVPPTSSTSVARRPQPVRYAATTTVLQNKQHGPQLCLGLVLDSLPPQCSGPDIVGWQWQHVPGVHAVNGTTWADVHVVGTFDGTRFTLMQPPALPPPSPALQPALARRSPQLCTQPTGSDSAIALWLDRPSEDEIPGLVSLWVTGPGTGTPGSRFVVNVRVRPGYAARATDLIRRSYAGGLCVVENDLPRLAALKRVSGELSTLRAASPLGAVYGDYIDESRSVVNVMVAVASPAAERFAQQRWHGAVALEGLLTPVR
jgi:hypothetical protein